MGGSRNTTDACPALRWLDENPFATLTVPPFLILIQFLDMILLFRLGPPESMADTHGNAALCILFPFALSLVIIPALMLAVRQVFFLFVAFFVMCFVVRTFT